MLVMDNVLNSILNIGVHRTHREAKRGGGGDKGQRGGHNLDDQLSVISSTDFIRNWHLIVKVANIQYMPEKWQFFILFFYAPLGPLGLILV